MSEHSHLPEAYVADDGTRVTAPVYRLLADCFFGKPGGPPALWEAGTELQTDITPNEHMQPLNRAAAERLNRWEASLPIIAGKLDEADIQEAAALLAPREGEPVQPHPVWWAGVIKLAGELKMKRAGNRIPDPVKTVAPLNQGHIPPMSAGDFKDVSHRDQRATGMQAHPQIAGKRMNRPTPPMATEPKQPSGDAANA
jgi:hypothetical protein